MKKPPVEPGANGAGVHFTGICSDPIPDPRLHDAARWGASNAAATAGWVILPSIMFSAEAKPGSVSTSLFTSSLANRSK